MPPAGTTTVWDLADASRSRGPRRRGIDLGGPIAAALGVVALGAAVAPGLRIDTRWCLVGAAGAIGLLVAGSALRRRQALLSLLLAAAGLVAPLAAGAVTMQTAAAQPAQVISRVVPDASLVVSQVTLVRSPGFTALSSRRQADAEAFATALVLRLRTLHGVWGPYPAALALSGGSVVEAAGEMQGTALGAVPAEERLEYRVTTSGDAFAMRVVVLGHPDASVEAGSALTLPAVR